MPSLTIGETLMTLSRCLLKYCNLLFLANDLIIRTWMGKTLTAAGSELSTLEAIAGTMAIATEEGAVEG